MPRVHLAPTLLLALAVSACATRPGAPMPFPSEPGRAATVLGHVSQTPWQHLVLGVPGKTPEYFDLEEGGQIVVHTQAPLPPGRRLRLSGLVIDAEGESKRPGERKRVSEPQLDVTRVEDLGPLPARD